MTRARHIEQALLILILLAYLFIAWMFATLTPAWQAPDEPAHYNYVAHVATRGCCPIIQPGDWQSDYLEQLKSSRFAPELLDRLATIQYENHQPPLYYLLAAPVYTIAEGFLNSIRLFSALLGIIVVVLTYLIAREVFPSRPWRALAATALVAFLPQRLAITTSVNNDVLADAMIAFTLLITIYYLKERNIRPWLLGLLIGLCLLTKITTYFLAGVVLIAIILRWQSKRAASSATTRTLAKDLTLFLIPALLLGGMWFARNIVVYGFPDFLGLGAHNAVVVDQPRTADFIAQAGLSAYLRSGIRTTFNSFWGQFGWMALPMEPRVYTLLLLLTLAAFSGLFIHMIRRRTSWTESSAASTRNIWIILMLSLFLVLLAYIFYNAEFLQLQGRYLFPALIPLALLMALGIDAWRGLLLGRVSWSGWLTPLLFFPLIWLNFHMLFRFIVPLLSP